MSCYLATVGLEETVNERISLLKEQINPDNWPILNYTFQVQIVALRNINREHVTNLILLKREELAHFSAK